MGASGRSSVDDDGVRPPPPSPPCSSQPTCWELPSTDSKTPNPRPTKTMKMEESSDPPSSEVVIGHVPPPLVDKEESSEEKPLPEGEGRDELEETIEYDTDDILDDMEGWGYSPSGAEPDVKKKKEEEEETEEEKAFWARVVARAPILDFSSHAKKECHICYGNHYPCNCSYLERIPYGKDVPNKDYVVVCECGGICEGGGKCPTDGCLLRQARCVVLRRKMMV